MKVDGRERPKLYADTGKDHRRATCVNGVEYRKSVMDHWQLAARVLDLDGITGGVRLVWNKESGNALNKD